NSQVTSADFSGSLGPNDDVRGATGGPHGSKVISGETAGHAPQRRRSNRPGNSQANGPLSPVNSEEPPAIVTGRTEGASGPHGARESLRSRTEGAFVVHWCARA